MPRGKGIDDDDNADKDNADKPKGEPTDQGRKGDTPDVTETDQEPTG
jgi:hypothetical protein